jgi:DNA-binding transcriptional MerR regulator
VPRRASQSEDDATTYPLRAAARITGLSPELLRAWERRHRVVEPVRTPGGTRRYSAADLERLRLVKAAVDAGHRVGQVAHLDRAALERIATGVAAGAPGRLEEILAALGRLDAAELQRLLSLQLSALGAARFAREIALPLVREVGDRWASGAIGIASEHLASAILRTLLGSALAPTAASRLGRRIVFATLPGERHELGLLMAALTSLGAGADPIYLGAELPIEDLLAAVRDTGAAALALSIVTSPGPETARSLRALRAGLAGSVQLWLGGAGAAALDLPEAAVLLATLESLERQVILLEYES